MDIINIARTSKKDRMNFSVIHSIGIFEDFIGTFESVDEAKSVSVDYLKMAKADGALFALPNGEEKYWLNDPDQKADSRFDGLAPIEISDPKDFDGLKAAYALQRAESGVDLSRKESYRFGDYFFDRYDMVILETCRKTGYHYNTLLCFIIHNTTPRPAPKVLWRTRRKW